MSQIVFLWTPTYTRATMATLFFALTIWVLFHDGISELNRRALFIVFLTSTIVSHYGVTWATFFLLLLTWIGVAALRLAQIRLRKALTINILALFLVLLFFWYSQMTGPAFSSGVRLVYFSFTRFEWFLAEGASSPAVQAAFGTVAPHTGVPQIIEIVFSWLTIIFIATGILITMRRFKAMVFTPQAGHRNPDFLLKKFDAEYLMLSIVCCILLVTSVILPLLSKYYGASRIYFQMMVPLSIFFVTGGTMVSRYLKSRPYWVILVVLIPYFLCTTGMMTQVFGFPRAITLNSEGPLYHMYIHDGESYAAKWIGKYGKEEIQMFGTGHVKHILLSQGRIQYSRTAELISSYEKDKKIDGYIYLRYSDLSDGGLIVKYPDMFAEKSKIYTNGSSEIYK